MDMNNTTLIILAAGMGSRFGGLKQIEPVGVNGETILDYSLYDAKKAGFSNLVFIINKKIEKDFRAIVGKRAERMFNTSYVFQELDDLPKGFNVPAQRQKPWGTAHAVLLCANTVTTPFAVINADDFYGGASFKLVNDHLKASKENEFCVVGFLLKNTLTEFGTVARGICIVEDGYLSKITERTKIKDMKYYDDSDNGVLLPDDTIVSMNMWGLTPSIFDKLDAGFLSFLKNTDDKIKDEYYLPIAIDSMLKQKSATVKVLLTKEKWYGVTYKEDLPFVREGIKRLSERGLYV